MQQHCNSQFIPPLNLGLWKHAILDPGTQQLEQESILLIKGMKPAVPQPFSNMGQGVTRYVGFNSYNIHHVCSTIRVL